MEHTRNGFSVPMSRAERDRDLKTIHVRLGSKTHDFVVRRDAAVLMERLIRRLDWLEPLTVRGGWSGTYGHRKIGSSSVWSEHAAGTALDWHAQWHPQGKRNAGWSLWKRLVLRAWLEHTPAGRAFRWGNDFHTTADAMHLEVRSPAHLAKFNQYAKKKGWTS